MASIIGGIIGPIEKTIKSSNKTMLTINLFRLALNSAFLFSAISFTERLTKIEQPYPEEETAWIMASSLTLESSYSTTIDLDNKETLTADTPSNLATARLTLAWQAAHIMPVTSNLRLIDTPGGHYIPYINLRKERSPGEGFPELLLKGVVPADGTIMWGSN